jgi:cysteine-rich repeat protein
MRACLFRCGLLFLVILTGCDGLLEDYSGTLCNPDGGCIEGYLCLPDTGRCELEPEDAGVCTVNTACVGNDGCCPSGCNASGDNDCAPVCGNLQLEPGETCDDGNTANEDDCSGTCTPNVCGDTFVDRQEPRVEACDDGNTESEVACAYGTRTCTACSSTCTEVLALTGPYCGDATRNGPEACDDGNGSNGDDCLTTCVLATCGDGIRHLTKEECDDGNRVTETTCPYGTQSCTRCDATCSASLSLTGPFCGDARVTDEEKCDDGNTIDETSCPYGSKSCTTCNATCTASRSLTGPYCGDAILNNAAEVCDDGNNVDEASCPYGQASCVYCNATCTATLIRTGNFCGDGKVTDGEVCDDGNTVTETSCPGGVSSCTTCNSTCSAVVRLP